MGTTNPDLPAPDGSTESLIFSSAQPHSLSYTMRKNLAEKEEKIRGIKFTKKTKSYYKGLIELFDYLKNNKIIEPPSDSVTVYIPDEKAHPPKVVLTPSQKVARHNKRAYFASKIAFACNLVLLCAKIVACIYTSSISMLSSTLDSAIDILSSFITYLTNYKIKHLNVYKHPQGKTRLVPLSVIIISVIMTITNLQIIIQSVQRIIKPSSDDGHDFLLAIIVASVTISVKIALFFYCHHIKSPTAQVIAQDSRNDVLANCAVLVGLLVSQYSFEEGDAVAAILISSYLSYNWCSTAISNLGALIGKTASPQQLQYYGWVSLLHDPENILYITTLRAYAFGNRYLLEVDIVLKEDMILKTAHDIGESLQQKLEKLPDIERAFVHLDYERDHNFELEHKIGKLF